MGDTQITRKVILAGLIGAASMVAGEEASADPSQCCQNAFNYAQGLCSGAGGLGDPTEPYCSGFLSYCSLSATCNSGAHFDVVCAIIDGQYCQTC